MFARLASRHALLAALGALLVVLGLRFQLLRIHGSDLPFHDQWDAEALHLLRPWKGGGELTPALLRFHNEHHPVLTKALNLGLAKISGMWSALPQNLLNTLLHGGIVLLLARLALRQLGPCAAWFVMAASAVLLGSPLLWENMLWGFQSQFILCVLLGLLHLDLCWSEPRLGWRWLLGAVAGILTLGTIAAGFLAVTISGLVALPRLRHPGRDRAHAIATILLAASLTVVGFAIIRPVPYSAVAPNLYSALEAFLTYTAWPHGPGVISLLLPLPAVLVLVGSVFRPARDPATRSPWLLALVLWLLAITAAFAFGRAALLNGVTPRYRDLLTVQCLVGLICLLQLVATSRRPRLARSGAFLWIVLAGYGFFTEERGENLATDLTTRTALLASQRQLVRQFVLTDDPAIFHDSDPAALYLHNSSVHRLTLLRDPGIRMLLPPSVRAPLPLQPAQSSRHLTRQPYAPDDALTPGWTITPDVKEPTRFLSDWITPEAFPLLRFRVKGGLDNRDHRLRLLVGDSAHVVEPLGLTDGLSTQTVNFPMPAEKFRVEAIASPQSPIFRFSEPVATNQLDRYAAKLLGLHQVLTYSGGALLGLAGLMVCFRRNEANAVGAACPPVSSVRLHRLLATVAIVALAAAFFLWPAPFSWSLDARTSLLLQPEQWSAQAVPDFRLQPPARGESVVPGAVYAGLPSPEKFHGTYGRQGDATTVNTVSAPFRLTTRYLLLPLVGYPAQPANSLALEVLTDAGEVLDVIRYGAANPGERVRLWRQDLAEISGGNVRLRVIDAEAGHSGWFGFATPWLTEDGQAANAWQRLADSNRLLWLRPLLLAIGLLCGGWALWLNRSAAKPAPMTRQTD